MSGCDGTSQLQNADQQNVTLQPGVSAPASGLSTASSITQLQVGCQQYCFSDPGPSALSPDATTGASLSAIQQLLSSPAALGQLFSGPAGLQEFVSGSGGLAQLVSSLVPASQLLSGESLVPSNGGDGNQVPGAGDNSVDQSSYQAQTGGTGAQTQIATQVNATVQAGSPSWAGAAAGAVNQALHGIWQLQVGCLFQCSHTQQVQQAAQSDTLVVAASGDPAPVVASANTVVMRIWQLQIGCLFWCYATVQLQTASADANVLTLPVPAAPTTVAGSPEPASSPAPPAPAGSAAPAGSSASIGSAAPAGASPPAGSPGTGGGVAPMPTPGGAASPQTSGELAAPSPAAGTIGPAPAAIASPAAPIDEVGSSSPWGGDSDTSLHRIVTVTTTPTPIVGGRPGASGTAASVVAVLSTPGAGAAVGKAGGERAGVVVLRPSPKRRLSATLLPPQVAGLALPTRTGAVPETLRVAIGVAAVLLLVAVLILGLRGVTARRI